MPRVARKVWFRWKLFVFAHIRAIVSVTEYGLFGLVVLLQLARDAAACDLVFGFTFYVGFWAMRTFFNGSPIPPCRYKSDPVRVKR